jgi:hypothetical protein
MTVQMISCPRRRFVEKKLLQDDRLLVSPILQAAPLSRLSGLGVVVDAEVGARLEGGAIPVQLDSR